MTLKRTLPTAFGLLALHPALAAAAESEGGGLFAVNPGLSVWASVVFLALLAILWRFAWGPILGAVEARENRIQSALDESAAQREEAARLLQEHKAQLADARRQASEILAEGRAAADRLRKELEEKARVEAQGIVVAARAEIDREKDRALAELRKESVDLALAAAGRLMKEDLDDTRHRELVVGFLDEMDTLDIDGAEA
ncbi:MAG: F0F1 ATP synthase subunit B [Gemmatimonadetes bacterium]|nr:F0F1 ATP synthase subunit B [Gemmatimonadota bacterium]MBT8404377.1 F0F1 ATP synthase subunit B [Gemmatimonadota bacterium]NNK64147.1 F0F1 ATP synthase subunit B [Gemmatimonadota bacterium]